MFVDKQLQVLKYEIEPSRIKSRSKGNISLSYLEGFDLIETANKIFGHGNWSYNITSLDQVSQETNSNQNTVICYKAVVKLTVYSLDHSKYISKEDVGFGTGIAKMLADAHEGGAKEAVTDSLKRSMRTLGNQFGNSLYDKSKNHKNQEQQSPQLQNNVPLHQYRDIEQAISQLGLSLEPLPDGSLSVIGNSYPHAQELRQLSCIWRPELKRWVLPHTRQAA